MSDPNRNALWARVLVDELARLGVERVCVGSGSRSSPLVVAFARDGRFRLHAHLDERSAAFFALGAARATGRPAAVVTTSGTAAANLLPAAIEASQGEVPLLLLTADRPALLRGTDANQTVDQVRLFGPYARLFLDLPLPRPRADDLRRLRAVAGRAVAAALAAPAGPVHLNLQFEKPLEPSDLPGDLPPELAAEAGDALEGRPDGAPWVRPDLGVATPEPMARRVAERLAEARRPLVVCGPSARLDVGPGAIGLAVAAGAPLLADPLSGARFAPGATDVAVGAYDLFLGDEEVSRALRPDLVLRIGPGPTSAAARRYLERARDVPQVVIDAGGRWKDDGAAARELLRTSPAALCADVARRLAGRGPGGSGGEEWRGRWAAAAGACMRAVAPRLEDPFEGAVAAAVVEGLPEGATLFVGNSMPVRDVDAFAAPRAVPLRAIGFRGASGIDGNVSGAVGAAAATGAPAAALLGDLTFLHDRNGLLAMAREAVPLALVVIQNDGGGIFHMLPIRDYDPPFTEHIVMPHGIDLAAVAAVHGIPHRRAGSIASLREALAEAVAAERPRIVEVPMDREENRARREAIVAEARRAAREALRRTGGRDRRPPAES